MDKYDLAIEALKNAPDFREAVLKAWSLPQLAPGGELFKHTGCGYGCLTQVRRGVPAPTAELTVAIAADERIPKNPEEIGCEHLDVFAEWQRRIDDSGVREDGVS